MKKIFKNIVMWSLAIAAIMMIFDDDPTGKTSLIDEATTKICGFALAGVVLAIEVFRKEAKENT